MRSAYKMVIAVIGLCLLTGLASGDAANPPTRLVPSPQEVSGAESGKTVAVPSLHSIQIPESFRDVDAGVTMLNARIEKAGGKALEVVYGKTNVQPGVVCVEKSLEKKSEAYSLTVREDGIQITAGDSRGAFYGLITLMSMMDEGGRVPCVRIEDGPDLPLRGTYIMTPDPAQRIEEFASLKLNMLLMEYGDFYHLDDPAIRTKWQECFELCRKHFIEPVPELQSLGWGHFILAIEPRAAEGVFVEDRAFVAKNGEIAPVLDGLAPAVNVKNAGFEESGNAASAKDWGQDVTGALTAVDATQKYSGAHGLRMSCPDKAMRRAWQDVTCEPGKYYSLTAFMKTQDVTGGGSYIEVYGMTGPDTLGSLLQKSDARQGTQDWQRESCSFCTGEYSRLRLFLRIQDATGTTWFDDVELEPSAEPNPMASALITDAAPLVVKNAEKTVDYEEGRDFRVVQGAGPNAGDVLKGVPGFTGAGRSAQIEIVAGGRIKEGDKLLVSFEYAPPGSITCCPSEPLYHEAMKTAVNNVIKYLKPKYIHIGHDEPRVINRDHRCTKRGLSNAELFTEDVKRIRQFAIDADPNVRIMMWADAVNPYHNGPHLKMEKAAELIPRDVIQCVWFYHWPDPDELIAKSSRFFTDLGFDITGSPWFGHENVQLWSEVLVDQHQASSHVLGELYTSWPDSTTPWQALKTSAQYSWNVDGMPLETFLANQKP